MESHEFPVDITKLNRLTLAANCDSYGTSSSLTYKLEMAMIPLLMLIIVLIFLYFSFSYHFIDELTL